MRILAAILLFLIGAASVAYSYIGSYVDVIRDMENSESFEETTGPIMQLFEYVLNGTAPQLTPFLYIGAFIIAVSVVMLIMGKKPNDN